MSEEQHDIQWALDLLTPDPNYQPTLLGKIWGSVLFGTMGFGVCCVMNWGTRRPVFSGIQKHILTSAGGIVFGKYLDEYRNVRYAERDAVLRNYVQLHPEDFPEPVRKKWGELMEPWMPVR